jgi:hypothetical protein
MRMLADRAKMSFSFDAIGFILGLGYAMSRHSSMILRPWVLSNLVLEGVPGSVSRCSQNGARLFGHP